MNGFLFGKGILGNMFDSTNCNIAVIYKYNGELLDVQIIPLGDIKVYD